MADCQQRFTVDRFMNESDYQTNLRFTQSLWRAAQGLPMGKLGTLLPTRMAKKTLVNFLDDTVRDVVRAEVEGPKAEGKLYGEPRIYNNLLSSQPLCFNLFAHLQQDLDLATRVFARRFPDRVKEVAGVEFEWSPGRRDSRYTGDRTAFDVFVTCNTPSGGKGFVAIEVKYHEDLSGKATGLRKRYCEVAETSGLWNMDDLDDVRESPTGQIWRDHLLALSMLQADDSWESGRFVMLAPKDNEPCADAVQKYQELMQDSETFAYWPMESFVDDIIEACAGTWIHQFKKRYLNIRKPPEDAEVVLHHGPGWKPDKRWRQRNIAKLRSEVNREVLESLLAFIPLLEQMNEKEEEFGKWLDGGEVEPGVHCLPYFWEDSIVWEVTNRFLDANLQIQFNWHHWHQGRNLMAGDKPLQNDFLALCMFFTAIIRNNRFCEGALASAFRSGQVLRILKGLERSRDQIDCS